MRFLRIFLTVLGALLVLWAAFDPVPLVLQVAGIDAKGRVTGREVRFPPGTTANTAEQGDLTLIYEFDAGGVRQSGRATVPRAVYEGAEAGRPVAVRYWPRSPSWNLPEGYFGGGIRGLPLLISGVVLFAIGVFVMNRFV